MKSLRSSDGFNFIEVVIFFVVALAVIAVGFSLIHKSAPTKSPTTISSTATTKNSASKANPYAVLSPATVPSKAAECSQTISFSANGDTSPIQCSSGGLNILAWQSLAALEPSVMSLGYGATFSQVQTALCNDVKANISNAIEQTNYQISALYYGWSFSNDPSVIISNSTCQNTDD